jgi:hypothetical protein
MSYLAFSTNHRIIMKHIILTLTLALLIGMPYLSINAGTLSVSGTLSKKVTSTTYTDAIIVRDCNGNAIGDPIPSEAVTTEKYEPYAKNNQTVRFIVTRLENPVVSVVTIDKNINNDINYNDTSGNFSVDLTNPLIVESRYNYKVQAKISEDSYGSVIFEREYALAPAGSGSAFPIGSVIAYLGNSGNVAGMETNGWFKCDGRAISGLTALSADEKTALTNILGGSSNLPDLRGQFLRGVDEGRGWDDDVTTRTDGESISVSGSNYPAGVRSEQAESMRKHTHTASGSTNTDGAHGHRWRYNRDPDDEGSGGSNPEYTRSGDGTNSGFAALTGDNPISDAGSAHSHSFSFTTSDPGNAVSGQTSLAGNENRPDNVAVYWLIRGR